MADLTTISLLTTAAGTTILAVATFASVRSANRSSRTAERAVQIGLRPVLVPSRFDDPPEKVRWREGRWTSVPGGRATVEVENEVVFFTMSLRNTGAGIAVLQAWQVLPRLVGVDEPSDVALFRPQLRDLYVPPSDRSFWQGALRDPSEEGYTAVRQTVADRQPVTVALLYSDAEGGQRTISRFVLDPGPESDWFVSLTRHLNLDRAGPR